MKPVYIHFKDEEGKRTKTFVCSSLKTGVTDDLLELADEADELDVEDVSIPEVRKFFRDMKALILRVFHYKFSLDELNDNVEQEDLMKVFEDLCEAIGKSMTKN